jgi:hypothetical protein
MVEKSIDENSVSTLSNEKLEESSPTSDRIVEDLEIRKVHSKSASTAEVGMTDDGDEASLVHIATHASMPASIMSNHQSGADLEKGLSGPPNRTIDENGKIVVNWTSVNDPENPKNWARKKKILNVVIISAMTFLCPLCSAMFVNPTLLSLN